MSQPLVGIVMGSESDRPTMDEAARVLAQLGIPCEVVVASAHRTPDLVDRYARSAEERGLRVLIAAAGGAAHLAGALAARTVLPVIGVPLAATSLGGLDALLSTVQMPPGVPVATVAIGSWGARNAALLAARILAVHDRSLRERLREPAGAAADDRGRPGSGASTPAPGVRPRPEES
ncbi:MAG: 5-(carboxyamino)imidazole ribonucleotide mutase [Armatimonadota bacterium]|nr:5-(carboxyamino)imidazole ribonucleotide mutase [Armatimonadota bacterium]MDR7402286.1 5-(carboxyamino)imidazole ribonucleotide mutase [Armatimonadota bacterium]MDR7403805.1 5-(carboxyamino)imidazole ribonucleotide mutase [Armatimonadota bacterium]MDR7437626.1 5-(carboxyamino)imidazole ribonucleotide mutase [Armatimonadota bacterium]MDR7472610.1 5-(carboxyamino)imidazole ribonucleotide mutase [Armatimonadota bacterium]